MIIRFLVLLALLGGGQGVMLAQTSAHHYFIEVDDRDGEQALKYGYYDYDEDFKMTRHIYNQIDSVEMFLDTLLESVRLLPKQKQNLMFYIHGMKGDGWRFLSESQSIMQKEMWSDEANPYGVKITLVWKCKINYQENVEIALNTGHRLSNIVKKIHWKISDFSETSKIAYLVYSMGNRVFEGMWADSLRNNSGYHASHIIMTGADLETDVFEEGKALYDISAFADHILVYVHNRDMTLGISKAFNKKDRLGLQGIRDLEKVSDKIYQVDVSIVDDNEEFISSFTNHRYFYMSPTVRKDLIMTMKDVDRERIPRRKTLHHDRYVMLEYGESNNKY